MPDRISFAITRALPREPGGPGTETSRDGSLRAPAS